MSTARPPADAPRSPRAVASCLRAMCGMQAEPCRALTRAEADRMAAAALYGLPPGWTESFAARHGLRPPPPALEQAESARRTALLCRAYEGCAVTARAALREGTLSAQESAVLAALLPPERDTPFTPAFVEILPGSGVTNAALRAAAADPEAFHQLLTPWYAGAPELSLPKDSSAPGGADTGSAPPSPAAPPPASSARAAARTAPASLASSDPPPVPEDQDAGNVAPPPAAGPARAAGAANGKARQASRYRIYTTGYDRVVHAGALLPHGASRKLPPAETGGGAGAAKRAAARFAAALAGRRTEAEEIRRADSGDRPDPAALTEWISGSTDCGGRFMKRAAPPEGEDSAVTLLTDNSGSMRGSPAFLAAHATRLAAEALERAEYRVEILGYTTSAWRGGKSAEAWRRAGSPPAPGRISDLLHIIYKSADMPTARAPLAAMLRPEVLKENIDGEALLWACARLRALPAARKTLIVISDGAPADDATQATNPRDYLADHLREAVAMVGQECDLLAIGIGCDVGAFYPRRARVASAERLAETLFHDLRKALHG